VQTDHRAEDNQRLAFDDAIHRVQGVGAGSAGILRRQGDLPAGDAARGVDLVDREFDAIAGLGAEQGPGSLNCTICMQMKCQFVA
jgi:hypothetical protein